MNDRGLAYLDTLALAKLAMVEPESDNLRSFLGTSRLVSSALVRVELRRAALDEPKEVRDTVEALIKRIELLDVDNDLLDSAAEIGPATLRSLDAIHLASALQIGHRVDVVVTYDKRMHEAAVGIGLTAIAPGQGAQESEQGRVRRSRPCP
jgi:uncharacterized protein